MGVVVPIVTQAQAEDAWEAYASLARQVMDDPRTLLDRKQMDRLRRAQRRWIDIANRLDA